ncbi:HAUS augmin-like complex subunit 1 [Blastocladiella emersonii ATCC 22665]|nr:HAUS augmin-like complex subunit 1 [Blastocladiella emersonii ATCC 22665]
MERYKGNGRPPHHATHVVGDDDGDALPDDFFLAADVDSGAPSPPLEMPSREAMDAEFRQLEVHLRQRLGRVPPYERTPETLVLLRQLVGDDKQFSEAVAARNAVSRQLEGDLEAEILAMRESLESHHLTPAHLSKNGAYMLDQLTEIALALDVSDVSENSMMSALTMRELEAYQRLKHERHAAAHAQLCDDQRTYFATEARYLELALADLQPDLHEAVLEQAGIEANLPALEAKLAEYDARLALLDPPPPAEFQFPALERLAGEIADLERAVHAKQSQLDTLADVRPDRLEVQLQLERAVNALNALRREREQLVLDVTRNMDY